MIDTTNQKIPPAYPEWHHEPFLLNLEELDYPFQVYKEFFGAYSLPDIRNELWEWLYCAFQDEYAAAGNLLKFYRQCSKLMEASYLIYNSWEQEETRKDNIIRTMELFFGIFAHEMKSQFSGIIQCCQCLQEGQDRDFYLQSIIGVSRHALNTMDNLLTTTKHHVNRLEMLAERESFHFGSWANTILQPFDAVSCQQHKSILLKMHPSLKEIKIQADKPKLGQIVHNLVNNAIKFSPSHASILVTFFPEGTSLILQVINYGNGIPADKIDLLFKPYQQVEGGNGGTGLGLYICQLYAEAMGGKIEVQSEEKNSTTFTVYIPGCLSEEPIQSEIMKR